MVDFAELRRRKRMMGGIRIWNRRNHETPPGAKYVGRPTVYGNPFIIGVDGDRGECCIKHEIWLDTGIGFDCPRATEERRIQVLAMLPELRGKDLECWCWPARCHAETLAMLANKAEP